VTSKIVGVGRRKEKSRQKKEKTDSYACWRRKKNPISGCKPGLRVFRREAVIRRRREIVRAAVGKRR